MYFFLEFIPVPRGATTQMYIPTRLFAEECLMYQAANTLEDDPSLYLILYDIQQIEYKTNFDAKHQRRRAWL